MNERRDRDGLAVGKMRRALLAYYGKHARELPWRGERDPYRIWVSEVMLQQTQVVTVKDYYHRFINRFPTVERLARATDRSVCAAWAGLGYYRRARNLRTAARVVMRDHGGRLPSTAAELKALPGIGAYTAGAIASIAFGEATPAVDGNVVRVLSRALAVDDAADRKRGQRRILSAATALVAGAKPGDVNQALMDVGASICRASAPRCDVCPLRRHCMSHRAGTEETYPRKSGSRPVRPELAVAFAWLAGPRGVWLERNTSAGLWAGQWQLPGETGPSARSRLANRLGIELQGRLGTVRHELSHRRVHATVFAARRLRRIRANGDLRPFADPTIAPVSALARRAIAAVLESDSR